MNLQPRLSRRPRNSSSPAMVLWSVRAAHTDPGVGQPMGYLHRQMVPIAERGMAMQINPDCFSHRTTSVGAKFAANITRYAVGVDKI